MSRKSKPLLSVRLMTYNHESFILEALHGIDRQRTNFKFEVIIGDDFSTDETLSLIKSFEFKNPNVSVLILNRKIGDSYYVKRKLNGRLFNFFDILSNCDGKYIALLDGDDYWTDNNKLQKQVDFLESNEEYTICWTGYKILENERILDPIWYNDKINENSWDVNFDNFSSPYCTMTLSALFRKRVIDHDKFKLSNFPFFKDNTLYFWCINFGKGKLLNFNSAVYRKHSDSVYSLQSKYKKALSNYANYEELLLKFPNARVKNIIIKRNNWKNQFLKELYKRDISKYRKWMIRLNYELYFKFLALKTKLK